MATGRNIQLTKQVGEYLVAAELCRRGLIATTFTGNVSDYDIVAISEKGDSALIQVKARHRGGSWQISDARAFLDIKQDGKKQTPGRRKKPKYPNLIYVFVLLDSYGQDRFFILKAADLHELIAGEYRKNIKRHRGVRPRRHDSYHHAVKSDHLEKFEDRWDVINGSLPATG